MAWNTPRVWTPGQIVTAVQLNQVSSALTLLKTSITDEGYITLFRCQYGNNGVQSLSSGVGVAVEFDTGLFDTGVFHNALASTTQFTVPVPGTYLVHARVVVNGTGGIYSISLVSNGVVPLTEWKSGSETFGSVTVAEIFEMASLQSTGYFELDVIADEAVTIGRAGFTPGQGNILEICGPLGNLSTTVPILLVLVTGDPPNIGGGAVQYTASAVYTNGITADVTDTATWITGDTDIATVDSTGHVTAVNIGNTFVRATFNGVPGEANVSIQDDRPGFLPIVVGGFGFGMETRAGYGGSIPPQVLKVTKLTPDDGSIGTLRWALESTFPRVIVYETSGYLEIDHDLFITNPNFWIAGQTAPDPGVTVIMTGTAEAMFLVGTHDGLMEHFAIRPGGDSCTSAVQIYPGGQYNLILSHMSISWAQDEGIFTTNSGNLTIWRSIISELLVDAPGSAFCTGGGTSGGHGIALGDGTDQAVIQCLLAHNVERNCLCGSGGSIYLANNIFYNPVAGPEFIDYNDNSETLRASVVGCYFRRGSSSDYPEIVSIGVRGLKTGARLYLNDNHIDNGSTSPPFDDFIVIASEGIDPRVSSAPIVVAGYTPMASTLAYSSLPAKVGARNGASHRDAVDARIISEMASRTGGWIQHQDDVGGYPTLAVNTRALSVPTNPHAVRSSGYTNLEQWLHDYATVVES